MKKYKDFEKVYIGSSDIASLTVRSVQTVATLNFIEDGSYHAYECFGEVEIGSHYTKVFSGKTWLTIYDDEGRTYKHHSWNQNTEYPLVDIYRSGDFGCIIHWHN
ncbi:MAG: hypothetical protein J6A83_08945 [Clostridia bacterium]|nr:hypothetical protein [Clostridia bacterium]